MKAILTKKTSFVKIKINEKIQKGRRKTKKARNTGVKKKYIFQKNYSFFLPIIAKYSFHSIGNEFFF